MATVDDGKRFFSLWSAYGLTLVFAWVLWGVSTVAYPATTASAAVHQQRGVQALVDAELFVGSEPVGSSLPTTLPDSWNAKGRAGVWTYTLRFELDQVPIELWSAYIPRIGNRYVAYLNGHLVTQQGRLIQDHADHVQHAQLISLTATHLRPGTNVLRLTVAGELARYAGLSRVLVGPTAALAPLHHQRVLLQNWGAFGVVVLASLLALLAGSVAYVLRDRALTIFALACVFTAVRNLYTVLVQPPFDFRLWAWVTDMSYAAVVICLVLFSMEVVRLPKRWLLPMLWAFGLSSLLLITWYAFAREAGARQTWLTLQLGVAMAANGLLLLAWWRQRTRAATILGVAALVSVGFGAYDHISVFYLKDGYSSFALSRYVLPLFTLAMAAVLVDRFGQFSRREKVMRQELADELFNKTRQLKEEFDRNQATAALLAKVHERERLAQDLHDGMGMQLNSLLGMVERGQSTASELTTEVRTAIEQLRSLVDSAEPFEGDMHQLLGHIRYRIESRLRRVGICLEWHVDLPDTCASVWPERASALQQLLFELVTNVLKHARARQICVSAMHLPAHDEVHICFVDDGMGYHHDRVTAGGGSRSIMRRARELEASVQVQSANAVGTQVDIRFPLSIMFGIRASHVSDGGGLREHAVTVTLPPQKG